MSLNNQNMVKSDKINSNIEYTLDIECLDNKDIKLSINYKNMIFTSTIDFDEDTSGSSSLDDYEKQFSIENIHHFIKYSLDNNLTTISYENIKKYENNNVNNINYDDSNDHEDIFFIINFDVKINNFTVGYTVSLNPDF